MLKATSTLFIKSFITLFVLSLMYSCGGTSNIPKTDLNKLNALIDAKNFEIMSNWALPMATNSLNSLANAGLLQPGNSAGQISLIGNPNYVKIKGDSLSVYLPYFGERQIGGGYDSRGSGISYTGIPEKMIFTKNDKKQRFDIHIKMKDRTENFNLTISIFPNFDSAINVNSTQRFPIRYIGVARAVTTEE